MVLTKDELIGSLQNEVRILLHLATKIEPSMVDYRPTPKQRSTLDLLRYLSIMGPRLAIDAKAGAFSVDGWTEALQAADAKPLPAVLKDIEAIPAQYATVLGGLSDADFRQEVEFFGRTSSRGAFLVNVVMGGYAAYRTQLFLYLKSCGRAELSTMNLWAGMDAPAAQ